MLDKLFAILGLALLMVVHETGHYLAARAYGMRVTRFSIGFGPTFFKIVPKDGFFWFTTLADRVRFRLWRHDPERHGPTIFQVAMIPFLAFVQIAGMNPLEEVDAKDKGSYANASLMGRVVTIFAGPLANYLFASVLFFAAFFFGGRPYLPTDVNVIEGRPAAAASIKSGDRIVEVGGVKVDEWDKMAEVISKHPGQPLPVVVERGGERVSLTVTPANDGGLGKIGVAARGPTKRAPISAKQATVLAITEPPKAVKNAVVGLSEWMRGRAKGELSGPVGIVREAANASKLGWSYLVWLLGALSAYLGAFNLLPIPALDGGRLLFLGYEATTRRRPNALIEAHIHAIGVVLMLGLVLYVTVANDLGFRAK
jgi:regulator of sigma E protease